MVHRAAALLSAAAGAAGHASLSLPASRNGGSIYVIGGFGGGTDWYTDHTSIPDGKTTLCDPELLTTKESIADPCGPTDWSVTTPWRAPGTAPITSPCGQALTNPGCYNVKDGRDLPKTERTTWQRGTAVKVGTSLTQPHGGGWSFRLCPSGAEQSEQCFQKLYLPFATDEATVVYTDGSEGMTIPVRHTKDRHWTRIPIPTKEGKDGAITDELQFPCPFCEKLNRPGHTDYPVNGLIIFNFSFVEHVTVPADTPLGDYTLSWRYDAESPGADGCNHSSSPPHCFGQVWVNCADVTIVDTPVPAGATPAPAGHTPAPTMPGGEPSVPVCDPGKGPCCNPRGNETEKACPKGYGECRECMNFWPAGKNAGADSGCARGYSGPTYGRSCQCTKV